jgi:hypothetical protein
MKVQNRDGFIKVADAQASDSLDLVVPFTTPGLTRAAFEAVNRMGDGLNAAVRLVKVQVVPWQLDIGRSPVYLDFLKDQLERFQSDLPLAREIRLARELEAGLAGALRSDSIVILATRKRPWKTRTERLAQWLRREGYRVVLVSQDLNRKAGKEANKCSTSSIVC